MKNTPNLRVLIFALCLVVSQIDTAKSNDGKIDKAETAGIVAAGISQMPKVIAAFPKAVEELKKIDKKGIADLLDYVSRNLELSKAESQARLEAFLNLLKSMYQLVHGEALEIPAIIV